MDKRRVVAVRATAEGGRARISSGYVIAPRLVLTAGHAAPPGSVIEVQPLQAAALLPCTPVWDGRERGLDAMLLEVAEEHWPPGVDDSPVRYGRLVTSTPGVPASAVGFAAAGRTTPVAGGPSALKTTQVRGVINPGDGALGGRLRLSVADTPPADLGASPWRGMSGAALWADRLLCGVVVEDTAHWQHGKLDAVPIHRLLREAGFAAAVRAGSGRQPVLEAVELAGISESPVLQRQPRSPAELLRPQVEAVPFFGREAWLARLREWCEGDGLSVRLITGPGGQGKTRFVREFAHRLAVEGWATVQLRDGSLREARLAEGLAALAGVERRMLIVMDYAETRPGLVTEVLRILEDRTSSDPVRVLLVARSSGEWWEQLPAQAPRNAGLLGGARVVELRDLAEDLSDRQRLYRTALDGLARHLSSLPGFSAVESRHAVPPEDFADPRLGSALTLQMRALIDLLESGPGGTRTARRDGEEPDLEAVLLAHEEGYWRRTADQRLALAALDPAALADAVAVATLTHASDAERAVQLLALVPALSDVGDRVLHALAVWLRDLYPGADWSYWGALEPDRLGEYHVALRTRGGARLLEALLPHLVGAEAERALTVLARATAQPVCPDPGLAEDVTRLIAAYPGRLAVPAVGVAVRSENPGFLIEAVRQVTRRPDLPDAVLAELHAAIPERSRLLGAEAVDLAERLESVHRRRALLRGGGLVGGTRAGADWAAARYHLALRLTAVRRWDAALRAAGRAVRLHRVLARRDPEEYLPGLADSLSVRWIVLSELGREQESWAAIGEAVLACRRSAEGTATGGRMELHRLRLALALSNHSVALAAQRRFHEATEECEQAVDLLRDLARNRPGQYTVVLAGVLHNLANRYAALFVREPEAAETSALAVLLRRRLATAQPDAHLADLVDSLHNHAVDLMNLDQFDRAVEALDECLRTALRLAEEEAEVHLPRLARVLATRSHALDGVGRVEEAAVAGARAVVFYRALAAEHPERFEPDLARALSGSAVAGLIAGHGADHYRAAQEERLHVGRRIQERELASERHRTRWQRRREAVVRGLRWRRGGQPALTVPLPGPRRPLTSDQLAEAADTVRSEAGHLGCDVVLQETRADGTARSDLALAVRVPPGRFDALVEERFGSRRTGAALEHTRRRAVEAGEIQSGEAGLNGLRRRLEERLGVEVDLSLIRHGDASHGPVAEPVHRHLYCKIFVLADPEEVMRVLAATFGEEFRVRSLHLAGVTVDVARNPDVEEGLPALDDFVRWPTFVEVEGGDTVDDRAAVVGTAGRVVSAVLAVGIRTVSACSFEDRLPAGGRFSRLLPRLGP